MPSFTSTNTFRPTMVAPSLVSQSIAPDPVTETQYALQRFLSTVTGNANPFFALTRDSNPLVPVGQILRGYIRRSVIDPGDPTSPYRLYFMYNPSEIQRNYISYLDQIALDPGNAVFGSNNMAAPPGILDFSFALLFDRQIEVSHDANHTGTKVDYDFFDLVVRGVVPDSSGDGNAIPDNGVMMVNPHNVVVVFGQDLSVQGRVTNAQVSFEKFNNDMTPTRLRIGLSMKALYIGPVQTIPNYSLYVSQSTAGATIPYENSQPVRLESENVRFVKTSAPVSSPTSGFGDPFLSPDGTPISGGVDETSFARNMLVALGVPVSDENLRFILAWEKAEGGIGHNNPLNTTQRMPGSTDFNSVGVQTYVSLDQGLQATLITINNGLYPMILSPLQDGTSACADAAGLAASPWGTGTLVQQILGC